MRADGCHNHTGDTRVNHTGSCCQGVGSATCGCGNYDTCRKREGEEKEREGEKERKIWEVEMEIANISVHMVILFINHNYLNTAYDPI